MMLRMLVTPSFSNPFGTLFCLRRLNIDPLGVSFRSAATLRTSISAVCQFTQWPAMLSVSVSLYWIVFVPAIHDVIHVSIEFEGQATALVVIFTGKGKLPSAINL
jgi:hypothetical protein